MSFLLENGADIKARDKHGCTPLAWAVEVGSERGVRARLERDTELNYEYTLPHATHRLASSLGPAVKRTVVFHYLVQWRQIVIHEVCLPSRTSCSWMHGNFYGWVLKAGSLPWRSQFKHRLTHRSYRPVIGSGLGSERDKGPGRRSTYGDRTPLLRAVERGARSIVALLVAKGAAPDYQGSHGWSPLSLARFMNDSEILKLLERHSESLAS